MRTYKRLYGRLLVDAIAPAFGLVMTLWVIWNVDTRFFPVVSNFTIQSAFQSKMTYTTIGTVEKVRNCEALGVTLYRQTPGEPKQIVAQYPTDIFVGGAGLGLQGWGPVALPLPANLPLTDVIEADALFRCHGLWLMHEQYFKETWGTLQKYATAPPPVVPSLGMAPIIQALPPTDK